MEKQNKSQKLTWGTWEELLLACAVKRHGLKDWDSVAMEVQTRSSFPHLHISAQNCEQKFHDLKCRFSAGGNSDQEENGTQIDDEVDHIPWLDELKRLRVAELRQEVQRYDVSILSLQMKVKRLEEEREEHLKENDGNSNKKPDLDDSGEHRSESNEKDREAKEAGLDNSELLRLNDNKVDLCEDSDPENQSVNESNSTGSRPENGKTGEDGVKPLAVKDGSRKSALYRGTKLGGEESYNGSDDTVAKNPTYESLPPSQEKKVESYELRDSVAHSRDGEGGTRESSEVQNSGSLTRKRNRRRRKEISGGSSGEEPPDNDEVSVKSQPLVGILELIRGHEHSSLFERRLETQESAKYKSVVRQHLDLETVQSRIQKGFYSSCTLALLRDLLLVFTNATVFFQKDSLESLTAHQLRHLVSDEIKTQNKKEPHTSLPKPDSPSPNPLQPIPMTLERSDSLLAKHNSSAPILVCRKRSSLSSRPSSGSFGPKDDQQGDDEKPSLDTKSPLKLSSSDTAKEPSTVNPKANEEPITGVRSLRRSNKNLINSSSQSKKTNVSSSSKAGSVNKTETLKTDKNKVEALASEKKRSAADFLKRIKRNSPAEALRSGGGSSSSSRGGSSGAKEQKKTIDSGKGDKGKERVLRNTGATGDKKHVNENSSPSKRRVGRPLRKGGEATAGSAKRGRESSAKEAAASKRPKKRSRR
ncbi:Bromodomain-containing protein [Quillaja saponaria]|uniref:Bromodomain-containing protein n=1 Tax=Quillaja saponaria TaxID=32244 RepID=A0AAD7L079_QUISA|nr:Bromodomain-containing protein [Quillaja saponaria]